jgi:excisionase family DNA binding protein
VTPDSPEYLTLHEVALRLGVHYMTVYRHVRLGMLPATKVGGSWRVAAADVAQMRAPVAGVARPPAPWAARLRQRMLAGDTEGSWQVVEASMASGVRPEDVYVEILGPVLHEIGATWRSGGVGIEQEHLASGVASSIVGRLGPRFRRRGRHKGNILVAMPVGERHGLGAAMLSDILRGDGYDVLNLGADTPAGSLVAAMHEADELVAVVVSVADVSRLPAAERLIAAARKHGPGVVVVAGGFAIPDEQAARSIGADGWTSDARRLAGLIEDLVAAR